MKYGALSSGTGRVTIAWTVDHSCTPPRLQLRWVERGGPRVVPPTRRGFGTRLIEQSLAAELGAEASIGKEAGAKLMGGSAQAATSDELTKQVTGHGFDASKLEIDVQGAKVKLSGSTMTQEQAEKIILSLGNTVGIAEVDTSDLKVQQASTEAEMYTVLKGDTLSAIAENFYGKGHSNRYHEIVKANTPPVKNPD